MRRRPSRHALSTGISLLLTGNLNAATFTVISPSDSGVGSLREQIGLANTTPGPDGIQFAPDLAPIALSSQIDIVETLTITGPQTISGSYSTRIFAVTDASATVTLDHLTLNDGHTTTGGADGSPSCAVTEGQGGAVCTLGDLVVTNATIAGNFTEGSNAFGGAVFVQGNLTLSNSIIANNSTLGNGASGGGLALIGTATITDSTILNNSTSGNFAFGGGLLSVGAATLTNSTISNNSTSGDFAFGGGLYAYGNATLENSIVSGNATHGKYASGGGMLGSDMITLTNSIVSDNATTGNGSLGGGIASKYLATILDSSVLNNHTEGEQAHGGGIAIDGVDVTLTNSTVSENSVTGANSVAGGIYNIAYRLTLNNCTLTNNQASSSAGGIQLGSFGGEGEPAPVIVTFTSSIVSGNTGPSDNLDFSSYPAATINASFSLIGDPDTEIDGTNTSNIFNDATNDPDLAALANNGCAVMAGATGSKACVKTHRPNPASQALDMGANPLSLASDERGAGFARSNGAQTDIGAFETYPDLELTPDPVDFGNVIVGSDSNTKSVTVSNPGTGPLTVSAVNNLAAPFTAVSGTCNPPTFIVPAQGNCTLSYRFSSTTPGTAMRTLSVISNAVGTPDNEFELRGNGVQPLLDVNPTTVNFGNVVVGSTSSAMNVMLSNPGTADLHVAAVDAPDGFFEAATDGSTTCGSAPFIIAVGGNCMLRYQFHPMTTGNASQNFAITSDAQGVPDDHFMLQGNGVQPLLNVDPTALNFGNILVGITSSTLSATLSNPGSSDLLVTAVDSPTGSFQTAAGGTCGNAPFSIAPSGNCTLSYQFAPTSTGNATQSLAVDSDAQGSPNNQFVLQGTGIQGVLDLNPLSLEFGNVIIGSNSQVLTLTITNIGTATLTVTGIDSPSTPFIALPGGTCPNLPFPLLPNESCTLLYQFSPATLGEFTQDLTVTAQDGSAAATANHFKTSAISAAVSQGFTLRGTGIPFLPNTIPTLGAIGTGILGALLGIFGWFGLRRKPD